jgi:hypothetical protein
MDLKFSFGASNPLPLSAEGAGSASAGLLGAGSSVLELRVTLHDTELVCEGVSGDGGSYAKAQKSVVGDDPASLAAALRSVLARGGAELPEPLLESVSAVVIDLGGREAEALEHLGLAVSPGTQLLAQVDASLQARTGISAGTPIHTA